MFVGIGDARSVDAAVSIVSLGLVVPLLARVGSVGVAVGRAGRAAVGVDAVAAAGRTVVVAGWAGTVVGAS